MIGSNNQGDQNGRFFLKKMTELAYILVLLFSMTKMMHFVDHIGPHLG
jgi:hypothetical protein